MRTQSEPTAGARMTRRSMLQASLVAAASLGAVSMTGAAPAAAFAGRGVAATTRRAAHTAVLPRTFLRTGAGEVTTPVPDAWAVRPFGLADVSIGESVFTRAKDQSLHLARVYPVDRILAVYRRNAGLDTRGATPPGGWEEYGPAPEEQRWGPQEYTRGQNTRGAGGLLRGHYAGHFLSMMALAYASSGEQVLLAKVDALVSGLEECRAALESTGRYSHAGFLAAYGEWQFSALEEYANYGEIWAPWYTCHKLLAGLLACYRYTGNELALSLAEGIGRWTYARLSACSADQREKMWSIYIGGEVGGMNDALVDLYMLSSAVDRSSFLSAAALFDLNSLVNASAVGMDTLDGKHANMHIPTFVGYAKLFSYTGSERYIGATRNFWSMVVPGRTFAHGGTGEGEMWGPANTVAGDIGMRNAESCAAYNMLKVAHQLFLHDPQAAYMDYSERTLLNHILGGRRDQSSDVGPENLYMYPVHPGARKEYGDGNIGTCCGGTGLESHVKYQELIYSRAVDDSALYVNLYIASTVRWADRGLEIEQVSSFPESDTVRLTVNKGGGAFALRLRVPSWATRGFTVTVNGAAVPLDARPGTYAEVDRVWAAGDTVVLQMPLVLRTVSTVDRPDIQSLQYGPVVLSALDSSSKYLQLSFYDRMDLDGTIRHGIAIEDGNYVTVGSTRFEPAYSGKDVQYHMYFQRQEKRIGFLGTDSGVSNPARDNGTTFLDALWSGAPFADRSAFLEAARKTSRGFVDDRLMSARDRQQVLVAASRAPFTS